MIKGGPKIVNDGLVLCLDAHDAKSYAGEPVTNLASDSAYTWVNSGAWTQNTYTTHESCPVGFPPGLKGVSGVQVLEGICTTTGSIHFGTGHVNPASASTQYTYSVWFYQKGRAGIGGPYARANVSNSNLGTMKYNGTTGSSNWPVNKWIKLEITFTTQGSDTQTYISNYFGSQVGDTMYFCAAQSEQKSYYSPFADSSRSATDGWKDRTTNNNDGTLTNMVGTGAGHYRDGQVIMPVANSYLDFDGSDDRVQISHSTQLNNAKSWEIWFKIDSFPDTSTYDSVFSKTANWNQQGGILLSLIYGNLRFSYGGYWADLTIESISNMNTNTWYQVVGTGEYTGSGILMKGYLNGVYKGSLTRTAAFVPTNTNALYLGFGSGGTMNGQIAIFRVYEQTLTAAEVLSNYNATKQRFS